MTAPDPRLTRIVTRHFNDLQGLSTATMGMAYAAGAGVWLATGNEAATFLTCLVLVLVVACIGYALQGFYTDRFGRVSGSVSPLRLAIGRNLWIVFVLVSLVLTRPQVVIFICAMQAAGSLWFLIDCWPYRFHEVFVMAGAVAAVQLVGWGASATPDEIARATVLVGSSMVVAGLGDHRLLVRGMRTLRGPELDPAAADVSSRDD